MAGTFHSTPLAASLALRATGSGTWAGTRSALNRTGLAAIGVGRAQLPGFRLDGRFMLKAAHPSVEPELDLATP
jgi:hypothetical protein